MTTALLACADPCPDSGLCRKLALGQPARLKQHSYLPAVMAPCKPQSALGAVTYRDASWTLSCMMQGK